MNAVPDNGSCADDARDGEEGGDGADLDGPRARVGGRISRHAARDEVLVEAAEEGGRFSIRVFEIFSLGNELALRTNGNLMTDTPPCDSTVSWNSISWLDPLLGETRAVRSSTFDSDSSEPMSITIVRAFI